MNTSDITFNNEIKSFDELFKVAKDQFLLYEELEGITDWEEYNFSIDCSSCLSVLNRFVLRKSPACGCRVHRHERSLFGPPRLKGDRPRHPTPDGRWAARPIAHGAWYPKHHRCRARIGHHDNRALPLFRVHGWRWLRGHAWWRSTGAKASPVPQSSSGFVPSHPPASGRRCGRPPYRHAHGNSGYRPDALRGLTAR